MQAVAVEQAGGHLAEIIAELVPGEVAVLTRDDRPVARLIGIPGGSPRPIPRRGKCMLAVISEDDEHLADFAEYMA